MIPGNSKSLWDAVKIAKDLNIEPIPTNMYGEGQLLTHIVLIFTLTVNTVF